MLTFKISRQYYPDRLLIDISVRIACLHTYKIILIDFTNSKSAQVALLFVFGNNFAGIFLKMLLSNIINLHL